MQIPLFGSPPGGRKPPLAPPAPPVSAETLIVGPRAEERSPDAASTEGKALSIAQGEESTPEADGERFGAHREPMDEGGEHREDEGGEHREDDGGEPPPGAPPPPPGGADPPDPPGTISLARAARDRYLNYALSVITARALPDVRDGLKPVQRRILYAMYANLHLTPQGRFRKSAAVVGAVMAAYHPHGDQSIYDAMVRLAQNFSLRAPLVEGHGNFGSLDGDPPAAMRYTEARLRALAVELVSEIDRDTVPFRPNYDGTSREPIVLPARVPQLLVNGSTGIAVGMATNIPPHNLREVCAAAIALIDDPELPARGLLDHVHGPDFPLGGEILTSGDELRAVYETGRGAVRLRATWTEEKIGRRRFLAITSIPYGKNKATIIEKIAELVGGGQVPQIIDVRDESTDDIRIICELKRGASCNIAMAFLLRHTDLQTNFHVNMTVLLPSDNEEVGTPALVGLRTLLRQFLDFRNEVVRRRFAFDLAKLQRRIRILEGFERIFDALDEAIVIIRASDGKKDAAARLILRFELDADQVEAILELKLYRLAQLEILVIRSELDEKRSEAARIGSILANPEALWAEVRGELQSVAQAHGDDRRTRLLSGAAELPFDPEDYIVSEDAWVLVTRNGWIKRQKGFSGIDAVRTREGDTVGWALRVGTRSTVTFYADNGRAYVIRAVDIPQTTGYGEPIQRRFSLDDGARLVGVVPNDSRLLPEHEHRVPVLPAGPEVEVEEDEVGLDSGREDAADDEIGVDSGRDEVAGDEVSVDQDDGEHVPRVVVWESVGPVAVAITAAGKGLLFALAAHGEVSTKNGRRFAGLGRKGDRVVAVIPLSGPSAHVCLATQGGRVLVFPAEELKFLRASGKGVNAIRLGKGDAVLDVVLSAHEKEGLLVHTSNGREVLVHPRKYAPASRGGLGHEVIKRGGLVAVPRDPVRLEPPPDDEDLDGLDPVGEEREDEATIDPSEAPRRETEAVPRDPTHEDAAPNDSGEEPPRRDDADDDLPDTNWDDGDDA